MKNYEEMAKCVLEARDEHISKKKIRRAKIKKYAPAAFGLCFALLLGLGVLRHVSDLPLIPYQPDNGGEPAPAGETEITGPIAAAPVTNQPEIIFPTEAWSKPPVISEIPSSSVSDEEPYNGSKPLHWNEMTINQQYNMAEFGQPLVYYHTADKEVAADEVGDFICIAYMSGYDFYSDTYYHCDAEAYEVKSDESAMIAIRFSSYDQFYQYNLTVQNQDRETDG